MLKKPVAPLAILRALSGLDHIDVAQVRQPVKIVETFAFNQVICPLAEIDGGATT